jgi:Zn-dependent protease
LLLARALASGLPVAGAAWALVPARRLGDVDPVVLVLVVVLLIVSLGIHEAAHAWVALRCGDTTARDMGRLTVNPIAHIDPFMTIVLPIVTYMAIKIPFGGAKPVPVDFHRLRHPWRDMSLVALAGPASNLLLAVLFAFLWHVAVRTGFYVDAAPTWAGRRADRLPVVLEITVFLNLLLAVFNMIPLPPLDGSRVMAWLLPPALRPSYVALERFGLILVLALVVWVPGVSRWMWSSIYFLRDAIDSMIKLIL